MFLGYFFNGILSLKKLYMHDTFFLNLTVIISTLPYLILMFYLPDKSLFCHLRSSSSTSLSVGPSHKSSQN